MSIPKLRFNEFVDNWKQNKIGDISNNITAGATPSTLNKDCWGGNVRWMNSGELNLKKVFEVENRITELGLKKSSTKLLPKKCVLIGLAGQGKTRGTVAMNMIELCTNQSIAAIHPNSDKFNEEFLYHNLDNRYDELRGLSTGDGGRGGLNLQIIKSMTIFLPSLREQTKIANFLTTVDEKITQLTQKSDLLAQYKKGVMQKVFSQELRFKDDDGRDFPEWKEVFLGDVASFIKGKGISKADIDDEGITPCIRYGELYTEYGETIREVKSKTNIDIKNLVLSEANDVIIPASGETQIDIATASCVQLSGVALGGDLNIIKSLENGVFLSYYLNNQKKLDIAKLAQGNSVVHLYSSQLKQLNIKLPVKSEQTKIADFLTAIDDKVTQIQAELDAVKQYKQGLLQQMFI